MAHDLYPEAKYDAQIGYFEFNTDIFANNTQGGSVARKQTLFKDLFTFFKRTLLLNMDMV